MFIGIVTEMTVSAICIVMGLLIWKKQKISLLHDYHYRNVKKEDIPAYARQIGIGLIITGAGIFFTGLLDFAGSSFWWVAMMTGFILGLAIIYKAQKKYNGSVMN